jgi:hypothetical protein
MMNDAELVAEFMRVERLPDETSILVRVVRWQTPAIPLSSWMVGARLPLSSTAAAIDRAALRLLEDDRFFGRCAECDRRVPLGWMHETGLCQHCAEINHGVVY